MIGQNNLCTVRVPTTSREPEPDLIDSEPVLPESTSYDFIEPELELDFVQPELNNPQHDSDLEIPHILQACTNREEICASLLALFYSGKYSQTQFSMQLTLANILSSADIPKKFNSCAKVLLDKFRYKINDFDKEHYCTVCKRSTFEPPPILGSKPNRNCKTCNTK